MLKERTGLAILNGLSKFDWRVVIKEDSTSPRL